MNIKSLLLSAMLLLAAMPLFAQSYDALWKEVENAAQKDLPQTQMKTLEKIVAKAQKEKEYGQFLKAQLRHAKLLVEISPDSLQSIVRQLEEQTRKAERQDAVLGAVMDVVVATTYQCNPSVLGDDSEAKGNAFFQKALASPGLLAGTKASRFKPMVVEGRDSRLFGDDLLSLLGYHAGANGYSEAYRVMHDYYERQGNRVAAMLTAYQMHQNLDSLIDRYRDLPECGYLAERKLSGMSYRPAAEKMAYATKALETWPGYHNSNYFRNEQQRLTNPGFQVIIENPVRMTTQTETVELFDLRNLKWLKMRVIDARTKAVVDEVKHDYPGREAYDVFKDKMEIGKLPLGHYFVEFSTDNKAVKVDTINNYISDLRVISESLPNGNVRYAVVNAISGKPVSGAHLEFTTRARNGKSGSTIAGTTDSQGIYEYKGEERSYTYRVYTDADKDLPKNEGLWGTYDYQDSKRNENSVDIYTDRNIYRPGQTVHASIVAYNTSGTVEVNAVDNRNITLTLRDANNKVVDTRQLTTDSFGTASADFVLPANGLTGRYSLRTDFGGGYQKVRVEEYKRPTFEVHFDEVKESYKMGDTITVTGTAVSYAGVPVQGAKVSYNVRYQEGLWWRRDTYGDDVTDGDVVTDQDGRFEVKVPLITDDYDEDDDDEDDEDDDDDDDDDDDYEDFVDSHFYRFIVEAEVTDQAGETRKGETTLPVSTRPTSLLADIPEQILKDKIQPVRFRFVNAKGNEIEGDVTYTIDGKKRHTVKANTEVRLPSLPSGKHVLKAVCGKNTLKKSFVVFSLDDRRPCEETFDWFYQSEYDFPEKGAATIQIGSSYEDVTVFYSVFSGKTELDHGTFQLSNSNRRIDYTYKEAYGDGLLLTYAWVKNGRTHTHEARIWKPLPDKKLNLKWTTFRDRLTPGQQETWKLRITNPDGTPAKAQLMATLYDKSLDQLGSPFTWNIGLGLYRKVPYTSWGRYYIHRAGFSGNAYWKSLKTQDWDFTRFSDEIFMYAAFRYAPKLMMSRAANAKVTANAYDALEGVAAGLIPEEESSLKEVVVVKKKSMEETSDASEQKKADSGFFSVRENLNETAFFYPALLTDADGNVAIQFTLPESVTTWNFKGLAHDVEMNNGVIEAEAVAKKAVMVMPNVPRFLREGDEATITARIVNTGDNKAAGTARLQLLDAETEAVVVEKTVPFEVAVNETGAVTFPVTLPENTASSLLICRIVGEGKDFSDGEQHYLPVLPNQELVTNTLPFTQHNPGAMDIALNKLLGAQGTNGKKSLRLTLEYTNNPAWLMVQALPYVANANDENAISLAASYYANTLGKYILDQNPEVKNTFASWQQEKGTETSLNSALQKNQELKTLVLDETPWVADADREESQKKALANFFDENTLIYQLNRSLEGLRKLQNDDGSFSWWKGMDGSPCMTAEVMEFLTRLNLLSFEDEQTRDLLDDAYKYLGNIVVKEVKEMKQREKEKKPVYIYDYHALQWVYLSAISGRSLSADERMAKEYLLNYLEKQKRTQSIYAKALMAVVWAKDKQSKKAKEYLQSLVEYTVYTEEMGRYYDTPRAGYSWCDYRIPTQTAVIEALQLVGGDDRVITEMQRWLLQEKRTQAWDTPINSVNAVYAFLNGKSDALAKREPTTFNINGAAIEIPKATAGLGYVKMPLQPTGDAAETVLTVDKTSEGTSWGALYAQFLQPVTEVENASSGLTVKRELLGGEGKVKVGDRVKVRLTVVADRDYDFVQVSDKRAACLEPVEQISGYHWGYYIAPKDNVTNYYFDRLSKGKHVVETEYYVDREGSYQTGTCTVQCAYAPEYSAREKAKVIKVVK